MEPNKIEKIAIIDFGSQFTQLVARKIRELGVYSDIINSKNIRKIFNNKSIKGVILSGGPLSATKRKSLKLDKSIINLKVPILGICYGHQILAKKFGGKIKNSKYREFGKAIVMSKNKSILTKNFFNNGKNVVWMSHQDVVQKLPLDFKPIGSTSNSKFAIIANEKLNYYGVQFHPEVSHTSNGKILIKNFLFNICKITKNWSTKNQKKIFIQDIKKIVKNDKVICALSGGVDSSVVAFLLKKAIGNNLTCIFVNTGFMRQKEENEVLKIFKHKLKFKLLYINASNFF